LIFFAQNENKTLDKKPNRWYGFFELQERPQIIRLGRRRGKPSRQKAKLSGKRTAVSLNPGKIQAFGLDTEGDKSWTFKG
jgi:hypothetical protein